MPNGLQLGTRRGYAIRANEIESAHQPDGRFIAALEELNVLFRALASIMYNCVPTSGHPGGSISSSRFVESLLYHTADYDFSNPEAAEADVVSYAAGHKAMGLYGLWALRNEVMRITHPELLPGEKHQLRLEDLLGFRRNPTQRTPLYLKHHAKSLDGHPAPATPFVKLSTGASGVGVASSFGLAFGALDLYPQDPPFVHVIEGEGGLTPGRVQEAMAAVATARIHNLVLHIDWNQASIDSNHVCRDGNEPGDYVQWNPVELAHFHDFNVILVEDGFDYRQILAAQAHALAHHDHQPTAIVYRTIKGWKYGIEGRASHGAGHKVCSEDFYRSLNELQDCFSVKLPQICKELTEENIEEHYFDLLMVLRGQMEKRKDVLQPLGDAVAASSTRLQERKRTPRPDAPNLSKLYDGSTVRPEKAPAEVLTPVGKSQTLRDSLGEVLNQLNHLTCGAFIGASADLMHSTSLARLGKGYPEGYYNAVQNPRCRMVAVGGICEDATGAFMSALGNDGRHIGVSSSYAAFIAAMQHVACRLHAIGQQARQQYLGLPYSTYIMICAHAGLKTGEDGPTHADPQCLQLLQENFPRGTLITLTPWDPNEMWSCTVAALQQRPAVLASFVTRPSEMIFDRQALRLPPPEAAAKGVVALRRADPARKPTHGTLVLQGSDVTNIFVKDVLPCVDKAGLNLNIYYITSAELFDLLPEQEQESLFPQAHRQEAMGITGFTLSTLYKWLLSEEGRKASLHAFSKGHYLGSGQAHKVLEEANLHGEGQWQAIMAYAERRLGK